MNLEDAYFLDCGLTYDGVPAQTITGLDHLEGETVKVIADGKVHPDVVVVGGLIGLDYEASVVHVGFGYTAKMKTLPIEAVVQDGATLGRIKINPKVLVQYNESAGILIGPDEDNLDLHMFTEDETYASGVTLTSGVADVNIEVGHNRQPRVCIQHEVALPLTINAISEEFEVTQS